MHLSTAANDLLHSFPPCLIQAYIEKEDSKKLKQKQRERMQPKMGKMDIDYQVCLTSLLYYIFCNLPYQLFCDSFVCMSCCKDVHNDSCLCLLNECVSYVLGSP
jgi:hypothetical protein